MKHIIKCLGSLLAVVLLTAAFTACSDDDLNGSANVGLGIKVFFPTKVVTNQPITINGSGFNGVNEIEFPGGVKVTSFETVSDHMIRVNAPAGISKEGGKIVVRTADNQTESPQALTVGRTVVSGFSQQEGETVTGGNLITVFGTDLEFINKVELLDAEGETQFIDQKDFYRKGTSTVVFRIPPKNIYEGTFVGYVHTYDGQRFPMPELTYEQAADEGHFEIVKTTIWKNDGSLGAISWSSDYRFAPESNSTGEECYTVPQDVWEKMKSESFKVDITGENPQIRVTTGWWSTTWTGDDIFAGNDRLTEIGDGTYTLTVDFAGDAILDLLDAQHLLFTGDRYTVNEIYFEEEVWVDGPGDVEVKNPIWTNDGSLGEASWNGIYRFGLEGHDGNNECAATFAADVWDRIKNETFYVTVRGENPQIRVTSGWWSTTWTGEDIMPGNEHLTELGDGLYTLTVNLAGDPLLNAIDTEHILFTGSGFTVEEIYFIDIVSGGGSQKEVVLWQGDGSAGAVSWNGTYRFGLEGNDGNNECIATFPADLWEKLKTSTFYLDVQSENPQIRVTTGWWSTTWTGEDIQPGNDRLTDNGDGSWTLEINLEGDPILNAIDTEHLLFTGDRFTPLKLYFIE